MHRYLTEIRFRSIKLTTAILVILIAGCATPNSSQTSEFRVDLRNIQTGSGPYGFDCDAPAGDFDVSNISASNEKSHVTGLLQILELRSHPGWAATASIYFGRFNKPPYMGVQTSVLPDKPNLFQFSITGQGGAQERTVFGMTEVTTSPMPFEITLNKNGELSVSIAGQSKLLNISAVEPTHLSLFCSTAIARFSNVIID